jgi:FkbM family methyltransferase
MLGVMAEVKALQAQLDAIQHSQLEINHNQLLLLNELDKRTKNSGSIYLSDREMATKLFSGLKLYIDPQDLTLSVHLALDSIWESNVTTAWLQIVKPGDVVVDIGANYGYFGALAAQKIYNSAGSQFIFFEANPYLIPYIRRTLACNWLIDKSIIENNAISDKAGEVSLSVSPYYLGNASLTSQQKHSAYDRYRIHAEELEVKKIKAVSLDSYCAKQNIAQVNLIKMDIEGHEETAYKGMRKIIQASPDVSLLVEFTKESYKQPEKLYEQMLSDFGHVYVIEPDGRITKPRNTSYTKIINNKDGWVMPIFSKNANLANK